MTMSVKHFLDDPTRLVDAALKAVPLTNPSAALDLMNKILYLRPDTEENHVKPRVSIVSGGGSGHEPSFGAFVGRGLLSAAVAGTIFASPSAEQVRTTITSHVEAAQEVLVIVMNYTGDILNFGMAVENARAAGRKIEMVVVGDDVGVRRDKAGRVGRRGIAGRVLVHKIAGALAARGADLSTVAGVARLVEDNLISVGASLDRVHVPGRRLTSLEPDGLGAREVEIGMGIHNEPGSERSEVNLQELVSTMLSQLLDQEDADRAYLRVDSTQVVLLINNLGGVSMLEMGAIVTEVVCQLEKSYDICPVRVLSGTYMTSLNGLGFSITLLNVVEPSVKGLSMVELLDDPCEATGWSSPIKAATWNAKNATIREEGHVEELPVQPSGLNLNAKVAQRVLVAGLESVVTAEPEITRYDTMVGDGDCGIGLKRGAEAILRHLSSSPLSEDAVVGVAKIVSIVENTMDGTSGAIYAIFLNALVASLRSLAPGKMTPHMWAAALKQCCGTLSRYTPARPGDRTLIDALYPFVDTLATTGNLRQAAEAAQAAAKGTSGMRAGLGRTVYVGGCNYEEVPDPGAWGLASFLMGMSSEMHEG